MWGYPLQGAFLYLQIRVQVDLGRLDLFVAEPDVTLGDYADTGAPNAIIFRNLRSYLGIIRTSA